MSRSSYRFSPLFALVLAAGAVSSPLTPAHARPCSWSIGSYLNGFVPDFDQKRTPGPLFWDGMQFVNIPAGLPGNGANYCSPTAHINWMAYFANHGFPALMEGGSSPSWQSQNEYENVTRSIAELGVDMQTHPENGTTCCGTTGMRAYLDRYAPNKFIVSAFAADGLYAPSLNDLAFCALAGGYVCPFVGWYTPDDDGGPNEYYKAGGHVITMVGLEGWCPGDDREIVIRDPSSSDNQLTQGAFANNTYTLEQFPGFFANNDGGGGIQVFYQRTHERFVGYGSYGLLNGYRVMVPKPGVTLSPLNNSLSLLRPIQLTIGTNPTHGNVGGLGGLNNIVGFEIGADFFRGYAINRRTAGTTTTDEVWEISLLDEDAAPNAPEANRMIFSHSEVRGVVAGSKKELYIIAGSYGSGGTGAPTTHIIQIDHDGTQSAVAIPSLLRQSGRPKYGEATNSLVLLDPTTRKVGVYDASNLNAGPTISDLPSAVALSGEEYVAISPNDSSMWIRSRNSNQIYNITFVRNATGGLTVDQLRWIYTSAAMNGAEGLDVQGTSVEAETLLVTKDGVVMEFRANASGGLDRVTDSDFAGLPASGGIQLARSRTNIDIDPSDPSNFDVLPATSSPNEWDCPGDVDLNGSVEFTDMALLLAQYGSTDESPADVDGSGAVGFSDVGLVLANWGPCR